MKKLAWLHAIPKEGKKPRITTYKEADPESSFLKMPDLDRASYVIEMLQEAGLMSSGGMSPIPLSWQEIDAWLRVTELQPSLWERLMIKELSEAYVVQLLQSSERDAPCPYMPEDLEIDREAVANKLLTALRSMKRSYAQKEN